MELFGDPGFHVHVTMAQMWGLLAINLADSALLPLNYTAYAVQVESYVQNIANLLNNTRAPASVTTAPLAAAQAQFLSAAQRFAIEAATAPPAKLGSLNDRLVQAERSLLTLSGLTGPAEVPTRAWYRHSIFAPATHNGYSATEFPGILDAITWATAAPSDERWAVVMQQVYRAAKISCRS